MYLDYKTTIVWLLNVDLLGFYGRNNCECNNEEFVFAFFCGHHYCVLSRYGLVMKETVMHLIVESYTVGQYHLVLSQYHWWNYTNYTIYIKTIHKNTFSLYKSEKV